MTRKGKIKRRGIFEHETGLRRNQKSTRRIKKADVKSHLTELRTESFSIILLRKGKREKQKGDEGGGAGDMVIDQEAKD